MRIVLKIGGNEIDDAVFLSKVASLVAALRKENHQIVLVHGGGKEITNLLTTLGIETRFVGGMRYTDDRTLNAVEMVLSGSINKRLVRTLQRSGVTAVGLSGVDGGLLGADRITRNGEDIGLAGEVTKVNARVIGSLLDNFVLVLSPVSVENRSGDSINVNADYAASAVASALRSELVIFLSNVPGVISAGVVVDRVREEDIVGLKDNGTVTGGMLPKLEAAVKALRGGARLAYITNADGAADIAAGRKAGTQVVL